MNLIEIFGATSHVTWLQECARGVLIFFYGLALVRLAGSRPRATGCGAAHRAGAER
jgi:hypothetical protein